MSPRRPALVVLAALVVATSVAPAADDPDAPVVQGDLGAALEAAVTAAVPDFWGAVLVSRGDDTLLAKGYGMADLAERPNSPRTLFGIASASKQITATAVLCLVQSGKLALDDPLDRFWKKLPQDKHGVTLRHLLHHTSGLSPDLGVAYDSQVSRDDYVRQMLAPPLVAEPGGAFAYSNVGYALLAAVVEEVTHRPFEEFCEKHLFAPAGMKDTGFIGDRDLVKTGRESIRRAPPGTWTAANWHRGWGYRGMGGVVTTVLDLQRWDRALRNGKILDDAHLALLHEPGREHYACGWLVDVTDRGTRRAHHSGSVAGYGCHLARFLEDDVFVAVLSDDPRSSGAVIAALEARLFPPPALRLVVDVTGYTLSPYRAADLAAPRAEVARDGDEMVLRIRDGKRTPVVLRAPVAFARKLAADLEDALRTRATEGGEADAATSASAYLLPYDPAANPLELHTGLAIVVRPRYESAGNPPDLRVTLWVDDPARRGMPLLVRLGSAAARALRDSLAALAH